MGIVMQIYALTASIFVPGTRPAHLSPAYDWHILYSITFEHRPYPCLGPRTSLQIVGLIQNANFTFVPPSPALNSSRLQMQVITRAWCAAHIEKPFSILNVHSISGFDSPRPNCARAKQEHRSTIGLHGVGIDHPGHSRVLPLLQSSHQQHLTAQSSISPMQVHPTGSAAHIEEPFLIIIVPSHSGPGVRLPAPEFN
ncbi:hypothetical protein C8R46DRAFT_369915 [Mycena filopes]|nr:hypothetical protein C8R46DRAFT_369915 [Mycena filopes]